MILESQKQSEVMSLGEDSESIKMSLDLDSAQFLMQMLSKNIYSDATGSTIRETVSNALDSHRKAKVDDPVIVSLKPTGSGNYEFSVQDFGVGLDAEEVEGIISKYGKSTKRESETELGMFGLGYKAPLAYSSSFTFICRKDGVERKYMMYEGEEVNTIDLLYESPTNEGNGVKIIVPVKYSDRGDFIIKIREQLAYFENVYFDVNIENPPYYYSKSEYAPSTINNDFIIHRSEDFQWSEITSDSSLHMCLDNVYYPLDFEKLGIDRINVPVALRFGLSDKIFPTINREAIRYTQESKAIILEKIKKIAQYFTEKYNETITDANDLQHVLDYYRNKQRYVTLEGRKFDIKDLIKHSPIPEKEPKMRGVELLNLKRLSENVNDLFSDYRIKFVYSNNRMSADNSTIRYSNIREFKFYQFSEPLIGNKKLYIRDIIPDNSRLIKKIKPIKLGLFNDTWVEKGYYQILKLNKYPKEQWRQVIKEFQYIKDLFISTMPNIDNISIPQDWLDARKKKRQYVGVSGQKRLKVKGEVNGRKAEELLRYNDGKNCKFVSDTFKLEDFEKFKGVTIYTEHDASNKLDPFFKMPRDLNIRLLTFSPREMSVIEKLDVHNLINYDDFMKGNNITFKRIATSYLIRNLISEHGNVFGKIEKFRELSSSLCDKLDTLYKYKRKYCNDQWGWDNKGYEAVLKVAEEYSLFDMSIYHIYVEVKKFLDSHRFIDTIASRMNVYISPDDKWMDIMRDMFKYYKIRMDYKNYKLNGVPLWIPKEESKN